MSVADESVLVEVKVEATVVAALTGVITVLSTTVTGDFLVGLISDFVGTVLFLILVTGALKVVVPFVKNVGRKKLATGLLDVNPGVYGFLPKNLIIKYY